MRGASPEPSCWAPLVAGVVAGRLTRGAKDAASNSPAGPASETTDQLSAPRAAGTASGNPLAGTGGPLSDPAYPVPGVPTTPTTPPTTGLTTSADPLAGDPGWSDTRTPGSLA